VISPKVLGKHVEKFIVDNAPTILSGVAAVGAISTTYLTAKATVKAYRRREDEIERRYREEPNFKGEDDFSKTDTVKLVWMDYIPPAGVLTVTVASIVCAHRVNSKRIMALATAYSLSEKRFGEYKDKIVEKFNPTKERQVQDEIAQDRVAGNPPDENRIIITGNGDVLCYDMPSDRYFRSTVEKIRGVQNDINSEVVEMGYCDLEAFYQSLGLKPSPMADEIGWTTDQKLDIHFSAVLTHENQPCIAINYRCKPIRRGADAGFPKGCDDDPDF
jgi:hypothetical protein